MKAFALSALLALILPCLSTAAAAKAAPTRNIIDHRRPTVDDQWIVAHWNAENFALIKVPGEDVSNWSVRGGTIDMIWASTKVGAPVYILRGNFGCRTDGFRSMTFILDKDFTRLGAVARPTPAEQALIEEEARFLPCLSGFDRHALPDFPTYSLADAARAHAAGLTYAPAPTLGYYRVGLVDMVKPNGFGRSIADASKLGTRERVSEFRLSPISAMGRVVVFINGKPTSYCSGTLANNNKTVVTAAHCFRPGAQYGFVLPNGDAVRAKIYAKGDFPEDSATANNLLQQSVPNASWDDWMVLDLERPARGVPVVGPHPVAMERVAKGGNSGAGNVIGYPGDVDGGNTLSSTIACGVQGPRPDYRKTYMFWTACKGYPGLSGAAMLGSSSLFGGYYIFAVISKGKFTSGPGSLSSTLETGVVMSFRLLDAMNTKYDAECSSPDPSLIYTGECPPGSPLHKAAIAGRWNWLLPEAATAP